MSYMSRAIQFFTFTLLVFVLAAHAADVTLPNGSIAVPNGARMSDEAGCRQWKYYDKLRELNSNYESCTAKMADYKEANPSAAASDAWCGEQEKFSDQANVYSHEQCDNGLYKRFQTPLEISDDESEESSATCGRAGLPACPSPDPDPKITTLTDTERVTDKGKVVDKGSVKETKKVTTAAPKRDDPADDGKDPSPSPGKDGETVARTTPQDPGPAQYEAQSDIQAANSALSEGNRCCNSPQSCVNRLPAGDQQNFSRMWQQAQQQAPASGQGLSDYCAQMKSTAGNGSGLNNYMSTICYSGKNQCEITCDSLLAKYESLYNNCGGCSSAGIYSSTYSSIKSIRMNCNALAQKANLIAQQGSANSYSGGYAQACNNFTGNPASMGVPPEQQKAQDAAANQNCLVNPSAPGCKQQELAVKEQSDPNGDAGFGTVKKDEKSNFNLQNMQDIPGLNASLPKGVQPQAVTNGTIANNSGGGIPGGGGGSPASLGPNGRGGSPGSPGYDTDVLGANASGASGYSQPGGILPNETPSRDGRWRAMSSGGENSPLIGMDLKQYLPGGSLDPNRKIAGISPGSQINRKEEDIWRIISNKMYEKCKLGVLWQCGPE